MNITERKPTSSFDFGAAITQLFRTPGGMPWAIKLILATGVLLGLTYVLAGFLIGSPYLNMIANMDKLDSNPELIFSDMYALIPGYLLMTFGALFVFAMGEATLHRAIQRSEDTPGIPLRFGNDEFRVIGASLGVWVLGFAAILLASLAAGILGAVIGILSPELGIVVFFIGYFAAFIIMWPFVAIRLAPAAGLSVRNEKIHLMAGRKVSKHRFWNMFLAYLVVLIVGYVASSIISLIGMTALIGDGSIFIMSGGELGESQSADVAQKIRDVFSNPLTVILIIIGVMVYSCITAAWMLSMAGIGSYIVKWWAEDDEASPFD